MPLRTKDQRTHKQFLDGNTTFAWLQRFQMQNKTTMYQATVVGQNTKVFKTEAEAENHIQANYDKRGN